MKELFKNIALGANAVLLVVLFWLSVSVNVDLGSKDPLAPVSRWLRGEAAPTQTVETSVPPTRCASWRCSKRALPWRFSKKKWNRCSKS